MHHSGLTGSGGTCAIVPGPSGFEPHWADDAGALVTAPLSMVLTRPSAVIGMLRSPVLVAVDGHTFVGEVPVPHENSEAMNPGDEDDRRPGRIVSKAGGAGSHVCLRPWVLCVP